MKFKRIGRVLVCLLLVSALLINASPIKAKATGAVIAAPIVKAATVTLNPYIVAGAIVLALGIGAVAENPQAFQNVVDAGVSALESAGTWVKDGMVELLRTEDADGNASYYVDSGLMEDVRSWVYGSGTIVDNSVIIPSDASFEFTSAFDKAAAYPYAAFWQINDPTSTTWHGQWYIVYSDSPLIINNGYLTSEFGSVNQWNTFSETWGYASQIYVKNAVSIHYFGSAVPEFISTFDLTLGTIPAQTSDLTDGTSARQWSEEYTDRGLKVYGGGSGNNNNDGKWFWPLALTLTAAELYAMSQADQWAAQTPAEFDDYTEVEELEIVSRPEVDFAQGVELAPVTNPEPNPDPDPDPGTTPDVNTDYSSWFSKLYTVVQNIQGKLEEIPNRFQSWITDCKTAIEELPSKFAEWFNNINSKLERLGERLQTIGESIVNGVSILGEKIVSLGQIIVEGVQNAISSLFTPSPDYFINKVEALKAKHHNIDKFTQLGNDFKLFFTGLGSKPPIIWIDLSAATGSYLWGGRQIFMDLTWYADYKPKMDAILGAIIWLWLAWRVFLSVPGIINGASGVWGKYHRGGSRDDN